MRVFTLLHAARPVLLNLGGPGGSGVTRWADRVQLTDADYAGPWELSVLGQNLLHSRHAEFNGPGARRELPRNVYGRASWRF